MIDDNIIPDKTDYKELYFSLIYLVSKKHPGETRHETAARCIRQAQESNNEPAKSAL